MLGTFKWHSYKFILDPTISKVNDFNAIEVAIYYCYGDQSILDSKLYFSTDHNYAVVRIIGHNSTFIHETEPSESMLEPLVFNVLQLKDLGKGIWFPIKTLYERSEKFQKITTVKNVSINQGLTNRHLINRGENAGGNNLINPGTLSVEASAMSLNQLIKICESYQRAINDVNIEYTVEYKNAYTDDRKRDIKLISEKNHFIAIKPFSFFYNIEQTTTTEDILGHRRESPQYQASDGDSLIFSENPPPSPIYPYNMTPLGFTNFFQQNPYITLLGILKDSNYKNILDTNVRKVNDFNAIEVAIYHCYGDQSILDSKLYFSINHNYALVRIIQCVNPDSGFSPLCFNVLQLKDLGNGIWFPVQTTYGYTEDYIKSHNSQHQYQLPFYHPSQLQKTGNDIKSLFTGPIEYQQSITVNKISINQGLTKKCLLNIDKKRNGDVK